MNIFSLFLVTALSLQIDCNDNLDCTEDIYENGKCTNNLIEGYCLIDNTCYKTYDSTEDGCGICLPQKNSSIWSNNENDDLECTTDTKDANGNCLHLLIRGFCLIEHRCYMDGTEDINACRMCNTSNSLFEWTPYAEGTLCSDGLNCTKNDRCDGKGNCSGEEYSCDDRIECTLDICDGMGGCNNRVKNNFCFIENQCIEDLEINPENECTYCNVLYDQFKWTNLVNGTNCDDKNPSTPFDYCDGKGNCRGYQIDPFTDTDIQILDSNDDISITTDTLETILIEREGCSCSLIN